MSDKVVIPDSLAQKLNDYERSFLANECRPLRYRSITNQMVNDPYIDAVDPRTGNTKRIVYETLAICKCSPKSVVMVWCNDAGRKTVYRVCLCGDTATKYNGHLERAKKPVECHDMKRQGNSRRGWSVMR